MLELLRIELQVLHLGPQTVLCALQYPTATPVEVKAAVAAMGAAGGLTDIGVSGVFHMQLCSQQFCRALLAPCIK